MKLIDIQWQPTDRQLRQFGLITFAVLPLLGWLWGGSPQLIETLAIIGSVVAGVGLILPQSLKYLFIGLSVAATPVGLVVGELAMLLIYFCVFLPIGIVFRLTGRDSLQLRGPRSRQSYGEAKPQPASLKSYFRQW
jgi:hypothetical protein